MQLSKGAKQMAEALSVEFHLTKAFSADLVKFVFDHIWERAMVNGERVVIPNFGVFDRRLADHGKKVWNSRGEGGTTTPKYVLRFIRSQHAKVELVPTSQLNGVDEEVDYGTMDGKVDYERERDG